MATSFLKSMQQANTDTVAATSLMAEVDTVDTTETWTRSDKYLWYEEYSDSNYSYVDESKNIVVDSKQINITQESKSQFIPFQMNRYYDGVDLMGKSLLIRFENKNKQGDYDVPVNVEYSDSKIRFGWLVSKNATAVEGTVLFEIQATGTAGNSRGRVRLYNVNTGYTDIVSSSSTTNRTITLPNATGTVALTAQLNRTDNVTSGNTKYDTYMARGIAANTTAMTSSSTSLTNGCIYLQYQ